MKFLVDENLPPQLATWLCDLGHDALHVRDLRLKSGSDSDIVEAAKPEDRIVVTKDSDFDRRASDVRVMRLAIGNAKTPVLLAWIEVRLTAAIARLGAGERFVLVA
jgi:predicted nuclease of predicted toxin-antitoxin system